MSDFVGSIDEKSFMVISYITGEVSLTQTLPKFGTAVSSPINLPFYDGGRSSQIMFRLCWVVAA